MRDLLKQIIFEQQSVTGEKFIHREIPDSLSLCKEIVVISGIRRCGKSVLLHQVRQLHNEKDYYLNFEDERLISFGVEDFQLLHELFIELFGNQKTFYFDEIQNVLGWERFVRRLYDSGNKVYVTGSNATMLSKELGTHLTGRYIQYELFPFSFQEYLTYIGVQVSDKDVFTSEGRAKLSRAFSQYFEQGGFPQFIENKNKEYLATLYESILYRDVMVRNNLTNEREIKELMYYLASNIAKLTSYNSLSSVIGVKSSTTVKNYIDLVEDTYMVFQVSKFDYSLKKQLMNNKKIYFIDNALVRRLGFQFSENFGRLLENLIFVQLRRQGKEVFYHQKNAECDFVIRENNKITYAIQVCYDLSSDEVRKREVQGLLEAMQIYNLQEGAIITMNEEQEIHIEDKKINVVSAWKWFLHGGV
jgi:uncharacterized protein